MTLQQDRPEDEEEDDAGQETADEAYEQATAGQQSCTYVPGSAADPNVSQGGLSGPGQISYGPVTDPSDRSWSMLVHLLGLTGLILPFANLIAPLIVWLVLRGKSDMLDYHGKRALNFQISFAIYFIVAVISFSFAIGIVLLPVTFVGWLVWTIVAAVRANRGDPPGYILAIPFFR